MEWIPKFLDNLDSTAHALYQSGIGYFRWVFLRLAMTVVAVTAMMISPAARLLAIAIVTTYLALEAVDRLISHRRRLRIARATR